MAAHITGRQYHSVCTRPAALLSVRGESVRRATTSATTNDERANERTNFGTNERTNFGTNERTNFETNEFERTNFGTNERRTNDKRLSGKTS